MKHFIFFLCYFGAACFVKHYLSTQGFILPVFAAWELAAFAHAFQFAWVMMDFNGFMYVSRRFNLLTKKIVLVTIGSLLFLKITFIVLATQEIGANGVAISIIEFSGRAKSFGEAIQNIATYIMVAPLFLFLVVNVTTYFKVKHERSKLKLSVTKQEKSLLEIIRFVDLLTTLPLITVLIYIKFAGPFPNQVSIIGFLCCLALTFSNLATGFCVERQKIFD